MHNRKQLILIGGGGHAKACIDVIQSLDEYNIIGYIDIKETIDSKYKIPYLGDDTCIKNYLKEASFLITVGQIKSANIRIKLFDYLKSINADIATIVSKNAIVSSHARIGKGSILMHSVIVQSDVSIGENCIINDRALLEHDVVVGDHCHISTGAIINGNVTIGSSTFIGSSAVVKNGITIGDSVVIGFASAIKNDINNNQSWVGNPAKQIN